VQTDQGPQRVRGGVRVGVGGDLVADAIAAWRAGRRVRAPALLREVTTYRNPGDAGADEAIRLARQGVSFIGSVKSARLVEVVEHGAAGDELVAGAREFVRAVVTRHVARCSPRSAGIVTAILIGDRAGLDGPTERRLQDAGTYHVIAISGGNIAVLAALLLGALRLMRCPSRAAAAVVIVALILYAEIAGGEASVVRATVVATLYLGARLMDHRTPPLNSLPAAAAAILCVAPLAITDAGFILSFGATSGILIGGAAAVGLP